MQQDGLRDVQGYHRQTQIRQLFAAAHGESP
jgi:hypothetical protein